MCYDGSARRSAKASLHEEFHQGLHFCCYFTAHKTRNMTHGGKEEEAVGIISALSNTDTHKLEILLSF